MPGLSLEGLLAVAPALEKEKDENRFSSFS